MGTLLFGFFILFLVLGVPIAFSVGAASLFSLALASDVPLSVVVQRMFAATDSFPLMAIPYFILAGNIMEKGGLSQRLVNVAKCLVGQFRGGIGQITVLTSMFFAAISGSGPATTAAIGGIMIPAMVENNYDKRFATALQATAGALGPIIPPSVLFVTFGVVTGTSIGTLFLAGLIPGILVGVSLMIAVYFISVKKGYVGTSEKFEFRTFYLSIKEGWPVLLMPVIILGGIYGGFFTPTESAIISVVYGLFLSIFVYKELKVNDLQKILVTSAMTSTMVLFVMACAQSFSWAMSNEEIPGMIANFIIAITDNKIILLLLINVLLLLSGCFIELHASIVILAPIFMPIMLQLGIHPVHFGALMVTNLCLGLITPPLGVNLYVASGIANEKIEDVSQKIIPLLAVAIIPVVLTTFIPSISLFLPKLFGMIK
jgi:C4-dicarboxylate transporter DctM subunit